MLSSLHITLASYHMVCVHATLTTVDFIPMAPQFGLSWNSLSRRDAVTKPTDPQGLVLEAWSQGFMVGAIVIMICITLANLKRGVILHKLILLEVCTALRVQPSDDMFLCHTDPFIAFPRRITWYFHFQ
jgi:hypothetical protein